MTDIQCNSVQQPIFGHFSLNGSGSGILSTSAREKDGAKEVTNLPTAQTIVRELMENPQRSSMKRTVEGHGCRDGKNCSQVESKALAIAFGPKGSLGKRVL